MEQKRGGYPPYQDDLILLVIGFEIIDLAIGDFIGKSPLQNQYIEPHTTLSDNKNKRSTFIILVFLIILISPRRH